jgi:hypothetical protein
MRTGDFDSEKFEFLSSDTPDYRDMVKVYYITGKLLECPLHGVRIGEGLYCKVCGKGLQYSMKTGKYLFGTVYIDTDFEEEIVGRV